MGQLVQNTLKDLSLTDRLRVIRSSPALLLDTSGSMGEDCEPGRTKINALREIVASVTVGTAIYSFNSHTKRITKDTIPNPSGGTVMSEAFILIRTSGHKKVIMITDGECEQHDQDKALLEIKGLNVQILYVGPGPKPEFLDRLANAGGSFCTQEDLKMTKELTGKLVLLLESPRRAIEL